MSASGMGGAVLRLVRGVASLAVLVLVLAGTPWLLLRIGRLDVFSRLGWSQLVHPGDAGQLLLLVLTLLGWASWLFVAATVVSELAFVVSHERIDLPVPGSGWLRPVVAVLVVSVVGLVLASARGSTGTGGPVSVPSGAGQAVATSTASGTSAPTTSATRMPGSGTLPTSPAGPSGAGTVHGVPPGRSTATSRAGHASATDVDHVSATQESPGTGGGTAHDQATSVGATARYIVQPHDDLWDLAQHLYADPTRWRDIASANRLDAEASIVPGQMLLIPHLAQDDLTRLTGQPAPDMRPRAVVVRPGDTLISLARQHLGSAAYWEALQRANGTLVTDPDVLQVGWTLHLPPRLPGARSSATPDPSSSTRGEAPGRGANGAAESDGSHASGSIGTAGAPRPTPAPSAGSSPRGGQEIHPASPGAGHGLPTPMPRSSARPRAAQQLPGHTEQATESVPASQPAVDDGVDRSELAAILAGIGALSASGLAWGLRRRRREREFSRPLGRRAPVVEDADHLEFAAALRRADAVAPATTADLGQTAVVLGENGRRSVVVDLADAGQLLVRGADDLVTAAGSAIAVALASSPWSDGLPVRVAGPTLQWVRGLDNPLVQVCASVDDTLADLRRVTMRRTSADEADGPHPGDEPPAEVWVLDARQVGAQESDQLVADAGRRAAGVGIHVVWLWGTRDLRAAECELVAEGECDLFTLRDEEFAELSGERDGFVPTLVSEPARRVLVELFDAAGTARTEPVPWWGLDPVASVPGVAVTRAASTLALPDDPASGIPDDPVVPVPALETVVLGEPTTPPAAEPSGPPQADAPASLLGLPDRPDLPANPPSTGRLGLSRRPDTEHPEAAMARIPDVLAHPEHPTLLLLGPVELAGARGEPPSRATKQCLEYCAWLMQHPGQTSQAMARSLLVAEGTRRSNMSRLRSWLGVAPDGTEYLPDAYSGRIHLHPGVTSDWEHLQLLISAGVNRASDDALAEALELVRGAPLADAAPGQWHWAEELRTEMTQTLRDIAVMLAERAVAARDADLARWACCRALIVAPDDELLLCARIRAEQLAGHRGEVERLVLQLTRTARMLGVDLADETVMLMQEVMEGRVRGRAALP